MAVLADEYGAIAPEVEFGEVDPKEDVREAFEIDSMDFLNLVTALSKRLGVPIPEADYPQLMTLGDAADYLAQKG
jgi:acyl carrier protein